MAPYPDFETFRHLARQYDIIPVYRCLLSDWLTPVSAFFRLDDGGPACLFESVVGGEKVGRYSFLAVAPHTLVRARGHHWSVVTGEGEQEREVPDPLEELRKLVAGRRPAHFRNLPPFAGGAVGYAAYDVVRYTERLPHPPPDDLNLPDLAFAFHDDLVVFDHVQKLLYVISLARVPEATGSLADLYEQTVARIDALVQRLAAPTTTTPVLEDIPLDREVTVPWRSNFTREAFEAAVRRCVEYIRAGDIFQVVLSQRLEVPLPADPREVYRTLRVVNPSPFMFLLRMPEVTLVGSSPEILCRVMDRQITVRPLAGTRPRGATEQEDRRLAEELLADEKERAEHVMLVDLGRNDVGRVAQYGSVTLSDVMVVERYSHVMHITSNVTGTLAPQYDAFDALRACLPAGTVSGAPKVRAMEIIDELEPTRRGPYAGAVGYFDYRGNMDTCITLRTLVATAERAFIQVGAGIVADSQPAREYQETLNKAKGLLKAIALTEQRLTNRTG